ncbi:LytR/AlgR family response regulator transcription factor [Carboxylicivirga sp. N1Y90]|uniref:LytR/AlgR family response regulator transcription factor n=1 Tax=Carboxylicivirga fragile TaxID=3417571 RepID=UPI003D32CACB|nr:response regulator transcription factor [Marinilabiliaceae bacterium N1Y90]
MINSIVIEDQAPAQRVLQRYIADIDYINLAKVFFSANDALKFISTEKVDLIFLDIHLPEYSGIELIKNLNNRPYIIVTTAFSNYAIQGYELDIADYLLKPFSFERFQKATYKVFELYNMKNAVSEYQESNNNTILVKSGYEQVVLNFNDIFYIKSDGDYTMVHHKNKRYFVNYTLKYWIEKLPENQFVQVHRSYIINHY